MYGCIILFSNTYSQTITDIAQEYSGASKLLFISYNVAIFQKRNILSSYLLDTNKAEMCVPLSNLKLNFENILFSNLHYSITAF